MLGIISLLIVSGVENESEILSHTEEDYILGHSRIDSSGNSIRNRLFLSLEFIIFLAVFSHALYRKFQREKRLGYEAERKRVKDSLLQSV